MAQTEPGNDANAALQQAFRRKLGDPYYLANTRAERFKTSPLKALYRALVKRIYFALIYRFHLVAPFSRAQTFYGRTLACYFPMSLSLKTLGAIEGEEMLLTYFLLSAVRKGDIFIDGGAHIGFYTLLASLLVGNSGRVVAFEPTPRTFGILKENSSPYRNIRLEQKALWSSSGKIQFADLGLAADLGNTAVRKENPNKKSMRKGSIIEADAVRLDDYCAENDIAPTFIKLDLEGNDIEAVRGSERVFRASAPIVVVEIQHGNLLNGDCASIIEFLSSYSYRPFRINKQGALRPFRTESDFDWMNLVLLPEKERRRFAVESG